MAEVFGSLAVIFGMAALGGVLARVLKQPVVLGYIFSGALLAIFGRGWWQMPENRQIVDLMGQLGVTLLLFLAGLELPILELSRVGKVSGVVGVLQVLISGILGTLVAFGIGWPLPAAMFLGVGLTFGSTIMVVKLLTEKRELQSLHGKIAVGILLVQDFVAMGILVMLSSSSSAFVVVVKGLVLVLLALWLGSGIMKTAITFLGRSTELLFISGVAWCLVVAAAVGSKWVGFSYEIGGLLAGLALASSIEQEQIVSRIRPLRDFFLTWFFVSMGTSLSLLAGLDRLIPIVVLSVFVLVVNPWIVMNILGILGFSKRAAFMVALTVGQMSEFGLVLVSKLSSTSMVSPRFVPEITAVAMITMTTSSYLIWNLESIYSRFGKWIWFWRWRRNTDTPAPKEGLKGHVVLFGHNRTGEMLRPVLERSGRKLTVVDFNPSVVDDLLNKGVNVVYGDMADVELLDTLGLSDADLIISTVPDIRDNMQLLKSIPSTGKEKPVVVVTAVDNLEARKLYVSGADFVLVPNTVGGEYLGNLLEPLAGLDKLREHAMKHQKRLGLV